MKELLKTLIIFIVILYIFISNNTKVYSKFAIVTYNDFIDNVLYEYNMEIIKEDSILYTIKNKGCYEETVDTCAININESIISYSFLNINLGALQNTLNNYKFTTKIIGTIIWNNSYYSRNCNI